VDFTSFVSGLINGTFRSIVDATAQQVREYADLVASISKSVDDFSRDNVSANQVRDYLAQRHPADLEVVLPAPGRPGSPRLMPRRQGGSAPAWLARYGLGEQELTEELTEGALLDAGRRYVGEERLQTLATMVLMGINRIVINEGSIRARLQFHASAKESTRAELSTQAGGAAVGIAARQVQMQSTTQTMVSTVNVNAQADVAIKADLLGEVNIQFRTETFPLERFADSAALQLIQRHAQWQAPATSSAPAPAPGTPAREGTGGNG
jgi:carbon monoxide dehydrogenase subunit G